MGGIPVVEVTRGGIPVTESDRGVPYEIAANGRGVPVRFVSSGGAPFKIASDPLARFDQLNGDWAGGDLAPRRNVWQYTEDLGSNRYTAALITKQTNTMAVSVNGAPVALTRMTAQGFYSSLVSNLNGLALDLLTPGARYLLSCFMYNPASGREDFFWQKDLTSSTQQGHGSRLLANRVRRVWYLAHALTARYVDVGPVATTDLGGGSNSSPRWFFLGGNSLPVTSDVFVGGFQIERVADGYDDGVAWIGDSTIQGASDANDQQASKEIPRWVEGLLNVTCFNRAVAGQRTDTMDARWATDITPLAQRCKYACIQGGVNDFIQSRALADVQGSVTSMHDKAVADGLTPVHFTVTPAVTIADTPADEANRKAFNAWLLASGWNVVDIAAVVDPTNSGVILAQYDSGDGIHPNAAAKRATGIVVASAPFWSFTRPTPYQKVTAATYP